MRSRIAMIPAEPDTRQSKMLRTRCPQLALAVSILVIALLAVQRGYGRNISITFDAEYEIPKAASEDAGTADSSASFFPPPGLSFISNLRLPRVTTSAASHPRLEDLNIRLAHDAEGSSTWMGSLAFRAGKSWIAGGKAAPGASFLSLGRLLPSASLAGVDASIQLTPSLSVYTLAAGSGSRIGPFRIDTAVLGTGRFGAEDGLAASTRRISRVAAAVSAGGSWGAGAQKSGSPSVLTALLVEYFDVEQSNTEDSDSGLWRPGVGGMSASEGMRLAFGVSGNLDRLRIEGRAAATGGIRIAPGAGLGFRLQFEAAPTTLDAGFAISTPWFREMDARLAPKALLVDLGFGRAFAMGKISGGFQLESAWSPTNSVTDSARARSAGRPERIAGGMQFEWQHALRTPVIPRTASAPRDSGVGTVSPGPADTVCLDGSMLFADPEAEAATGDVDEDFSEAILPWTSETPGSTVGDTSEDSATASEMDGRNTAQGWTPGAAASGLALLPSRTRLVVGARFDSAEQHGFPYVHQIAATLACVPASTRKPAVDELLLSWQLAASARIGILMEEADDTVRLAFLPEALGLRASLGLASQIGTLNTRSAGKHSEGSARTAGTASLGLTADLVYRDSSSTLGLDARILLGYTSFFRASGQWKFWLQADADADLSGPEGSDCRFSLKLTLARSIPIAEPPSRSGDSPGSD